ncbi:unnamed protein product [Moneuplotes crassus]|uniref:Uncharacterized protein n=1 Tax=Euplotes crassus TaxID=5936 RepID=A0AAD1XZQ2_EUPCR|nr:unnamed protein product [Moneuplotes crassus]
MKQNEEFLQKFGSTITRNLSANSRNSRKIISNKINTSGKLFILVILMTLLSCVVYKANAQIALTEPVCYDTNLDPEDYCYGSVSWNMSVAVFNERVTRNKLALSDYSLLLSKWQANEDRSTENPTSDCLAIARDIYCAYRIPSCGGEGKEEMPICGFMCTLFKRRCPDENHDLCSKTSDKSTCSLSEMQNRIMQIMIISLGLLFLLY